MHWVTLWHEYISDDGCTCKGYTSTWLHRDPFLPSPCRRDSGGGIHSVATSEGFLGSSGRNKKTRNRKFKKKKEPTKQTERETERERERERARETDEIEIWCNPRESRCCTLMNSEISWRARQWIFRNPDQFLIASRGIALGGRKGTREQEGEQELHRRRGKIRRS